MILTDIEPDSEDMALSLLNDNDLSWPEIEVIWRKTINFLLQYIRNNDTASIFNKLLHYPKPMGYKLVSYEKSFKFILKYSFINN